MCWADKLAVFVTGTIALALLLMHSLGNPAPAYANVSTGMAMSAFFDVMALVIFKLMLPFWLFLRLLDFLLGGPARRRGEVKARIL